MKLPTIAVAISVSVCSTIHAFQPTFTSPPSTRWSIRRQIIPRRHTSIPASSAFSSPISTTISSSSLRSTNNLPQLGDASRFRSNSNNNDDDDDDDDVNNSNNNTNNPAAKPPLPLNPKGVIFDMDGTLIQHVIDFPSMRRRIYRVADDDPIGKYLEKTCVLQLAAQLSPEGQRRANEIFEQIEEQALRDMALKEGALELLTFLHERGLRKGILTRNMERNAIHMRKMYHVELTRRGRTSRDEMENNFLIDEESVFHPIVARNTKSDPHDDEPITSKPHPDGILHICSLWGCHPSEVIMVGDSANDDVAAANRAGCGGAVLLTQPGGRRLDTDSGYAVGDSEEEIRERTPTLIVESLLELKDCLESVLDRREGDFDVSVAGAKMKDGMVYNFEKSDYSVVIPGITVKNV